MEKEKKKKRKISERLPSRTESDSTIRERRTKGKQHVISESEPKKDPRKQKKDDRSGLDEDVIRNVNTSLANDLGMIKTKLMNMEECERHREAEMEDMRKTILDQRVLIKKLLIELNEVKKETKVGETNLKLR